ncbi:MAG: DNA polymerase III subunit delta [Proteobacteria bacterium]|nr:DNA polymerase III subunit delta [Pseudomonadota bacterium]
MKHVHFIYGNQPFEIEEEVEKLVNKLLPEDNRKEAVFTFDIEDFFSKDQNQNRNSISDFKSTCETVSFFSPVILVHLKNLQSLVLKKKGKEPLSKELERINLVKVKIDGNVEWVDADTLVTPPQSHYRINGRQIAQSISVETGNTHRIVLDETWKNRIVFQQKSSKFQQLSIKELLSQKLNCDLEFVDAAADSTLNASVSDDFVALLCDYLASPPPQVELVITADIKNTREINQKIYSLIKTHANQTKKTVAYDDFRPVTWVMERAQKKHLTLDRTAADLMIEIAGSDYGNLDMELDKLTVLLPQDQNVLPEVLIRSVSQSKSFTVFRITDSLLKKDLKEALECLETLLNTHSADYISIFALIAAQFRKALKISWMSEQGLPEKIIIDNLGINQWIGKQLIKQVQNFTTKELENLVIFISKCDVQLKYSSKGASTLLENICFLICQNEFRKFKSIKSKWLP